MFKSNGLQRIVLVLLSTVFSLFFGFFSFGLSLFRGLLGHFEVLVPGVLSRFIHQ